jgi:hypothetical protein
LHQECGFLGIDFTHPGRPSRRTQAQLEDASSLLLMSCSGVEGGVSLKHAGAASEWHAGPVADGAQWDGGRAAQQAGARGRRRPGEWRARPLAVGAEQGAPN